MDMDITPTTENTINIAPMNVYGWRFEFVNSELHIVSEDDPDAQVNLNAQAAFSLLDYLYQYREKIHETTQTPLGSIVSVYWQFLPVVSLLSASHCGETAPGNFSAAPITGGDGHHSDPVSSQQYPLWRDIRVCVPVLRHARVQ